MVEQEVLIVEVLTVYAEGACSILMQEVARLHPHVFGDSVEAASLVACRLSIEKELSCAHLPEIFCCLGSHIRKQLDLQATKLGGTGAYIKEYNWVGLAAYHSCHLL